MVVGDVQPLEVLALAKKHFGLLEPSEITPPLLRPEVEQFGLKQITVKRPAKLPYLVMGYKVPVLKTLVKEEQWKIYALTVLAHLLDGGDSARLSKHLVRGQEIATIASADYDLFNRLTETFTFGGIPTEKHTVSELKTAFREQIKQLQTTPVDNAELERVKIQLRASQVYELDSIFYQGMKIGMLEAVGLDWQVFEHYLENIKAVTAKQVQAVATEYLVDDRLTVGILEPLSLEIKGKMKP